MVGFCHSEARVDSFVNLYGLIDELLIKMPDDLVGIRL